ncbi:MAG: hypothetical protein ACOC7S_01810 [Planctomycetota bacterium]
MRGRIVVYTLLGLCTAALIVLLFARRAGNQTAEFPTGAQLQGERTEANTPSPDAVMAERSQRPQQKQQLRAPQTLVAQTKSGAKTIEVGPGITLSRFVSYVELRWDPVPQADSYRLYWSGTPGCDRQSATVIKDVTSPYEHHVEPRDGGLFYRISAAKDGVESELSPEVSSRPPSKFVRF